MNQYTQNSSMQIQDIGEFQILKPISNSNFIQIFQVRNNKDGQNYTLKIADPKNSAFGEHEKEILKIIDSPKIIKFIDLRLDQQYQLTILEDFEYTLEEFWIQNNKKFSEFMALDITKKILEGLEILEQNDIVHANLCMKNIYIKQPMYKIANFEHSYLNKKVGWAQVQIAPEQFMPGYLTSKADIFSLGCMLFEMIFRQFPFNQYSIPEYLDQIQQGQLQFNQEKDMLDSNFAIELIKKMVQYNPKQRPGIIEIRQMIDENNAIKSSQNPALQTQTPQSNPNLWGGNNQNYIFETQHFTLEFVETVSKNALFFFEVAEKFGGKQFYNWKKTMYPRFMLYKRSYAELLQFTKDVRARADLKQFKVCLEKNETTLYKLKITLEQILKPLKNKDDYQYKITKWEQELNTDTNALFYNNYQKALKYLMDYFKESQIPFSKSKETSQKVKEMLILQLQVQTCETFNPYFDNQKEKLEELEELEKQTNEFLLKKAGYEK
ncbi:unnamed protein product (macronuclear) [Paramecium tetraurelia]|uniref:Protein kinase domain-containing protein n=1 Tax=Paramecium tetraurelia TaxID=5888 RepID=A0E6E2_PARTE|nr:uncharacterized protein GSPATT00003724001 [Paramecium tetraurelia]CAK90859.1 unnamed protein product [Paramecium tetraurelia]|eukprot:XP_001458256.1 hypothetical protein (macronuclear) [Paramecium tetraurelia strain d4-2]